MMKILAIATSDDTVIRGHKTGLWLSELTHFLEITTRAGMTYDIASPRGGRVPLDEHSATSRQRADPINARFLADQAFVAQLEGSLRCADLDPSPYAAIYLSGGHGTMFDFRQSADLQRIITRMAGQGAWLTGVCHGVSGFVDSVDPSGRVIVRDRLVTGYSNVEDTLGLTRSAMPFLLEDELKRSGAKYRKNLVPFTSRVEVDGPLVTGQNPQSAGAVGKRLVELLTAGASRT